MNKRIRFSLCAVLLAAAGSTVAEPLANLPAGLYRQSGNTTVTYSGGSWSRPPESPGIAAERKVCVPADSGAWYQAQLRRFPQTVTPQMQEKGVIRVELRARVGTDREGRPEVWFGYSEDSRDGESEVISHMHTNLFYTYLGKPCPADAAAAP